MTNQKEQARRAYQVYSEMRGFKVGQKVRVVNNAVDSQGGWEKDWISKMDEKVGSIHTITAVDHETGVELDHYFEYPAFCLEIVEEPVEEKEWEVIKIDGVEYEVRKKGETE